MAKYAESRDSIRTGDLLAWSHRGIRSFYDFKVWLVRLFTQSEYTHVGIAWVVGGRVLILEAVGTGVRIFPLSLELPFYHIPWRALTEDQLEFALSKEGQKYSYVECAAAWFGRNDATDNRWQCAEYVRAIHHLECRATPSAVVNHLLASGATLREIQP
mgnify:CR=1 FL=1